MRLPFLTLRGFKRPREVITVALGRLEREVMNIVWGRGEVSVRDVFGLFDRRTAYTTLMTTLDRLHKKGLLDRRREGRAFLYSARVSPEQLTRSMARDIIDGLLARENGNVEPVLACIVEAVGEHDRALLDELDRLIQDQRRKLHLEE